MNVSNFILMKLFSLTPLFAVFFLAPQWTSTSIQDGQSLSAIIDGYVLTKDGGAVSNALVYLAEDPEFLNPVTTITNDEGYYKFDGVVTMQDYYLKVNKDDQTLDGVSVIDLVRVQQHLLGKNTFTSFDQFIAADANNSQNVSAIDLIELKKLILGIYTDLPNNTSWRFGAMPVDPSGNNFLSVKTLLNLGGDERVDFMGIKIGDIK